MTTMKANKNPLKDYSNVKSICTWLNCGVGYLERGFAFISEQENLSVIASSS
jgi:hypothetical protein